MSCTSSDVSVLFERLRFDLKLFNLRPAEDSSQYLNQFCYGHTLTQPLLGGDTLMIQGNFDNAREGANYIRHGVTITLCRPNGDTEEVGFFRDLVVEKAHYVSYDPAMTSVTQSVLGFIQKYLQEALTPIQTALGGIPNYREICRATHFNPNASDTLPLCGFEFSPNLNKNMNRNVKWGGDPTHLFQEGEICWLFKTDQFKSGHIAAIQIRRSSNTEYERGHQCHLYNLYLVSDPPRFRGNTLLIPETTLPEYFGGGILYPRNDFSNGMVCALMAASEEATRSKENLSLLMGALQNLKIQNPTE